MDINKFFIKAKDYGLQNTELRISRQSRLSVIVFDGVKESYTVADDSSLTVRGTVDGKCGVFKSDRTDDGVTDTALKAVRESAAYGNPVDERFFIPAGAYEYEQLDLFNPVLDGVTPAQYIALGERICAKAKKDSRISQVQVSIEYEDDHSGLANSNGLDLAFRSNCVTVYAEVKAESNGDVQSGSNYEFITDMAAFDEDGFVAALIDDAAGLLGGGSIKTGKYDVVYAPDCAASIVRALLTSFSAFNAEQHLSLLEGKMGSKVFSEQLNIEQTPIGTDVFCSPFDSEGVPRKNGMLVKAGVPTGYVYDLATAARANTQSTGNGSLQGANVRPAVRYATVHGDMSKEQLFNKVGNGVYITSLAGAHAGMDPRSGNYSLQASGYIIKDGKLDKAVSLMTVAGNIVTDLQNIIGIADDSKVTLSAVKTPSVAVRALSVSGVEK